MKKACIKKPAAPSLKTKSTPLDYGYCKYCSKPMVFVKKEEPICSDCKVDTVKVKKKNYKSDVVKVKKNYDSLGPDDASPTCQFHFYCQNHKPNWVVPECIKPCQFLKVTCLTNEDGTGEEKYYRLCEEHRDIVLDLEDIPAKLAKANQANAAAGYLPAEKS